MLHLVLGGARSGKSSFAERWLLQQAENTLSSPIYVATAEALDDEMSERILHHQQLRSEKPWQLLECPLLLSDLLADISGEKYVLIDCLTLWLTNQLMAVMAVEDNTNDITKQLNERVEQLISSLCQHPATIVVVANEIGLGVVPLGKETRLFVDHAGWLNQKVAQLAEQVTLVTAGIPMTLKPNHEQHVSTREQGIDRG
ncbi:bifunctional adenosylcobinamide kinase/adenosylcobinamide-phosphate guanylyltransferase [Colwelliaceae bacterium 6441]